MRTKKYLILITTIFIFLLTGCNVKFIEKVEQPTSTPTPTPSFGEITIIPPTETPTPTPTPIIEDEYVSRQETYASIVFNIFYTAKKLYVKEETFAKILPNEKSKDYIALAINDEIVMKGVSEDENWALISVYGEAASFIKLDLLSEYRIVIETPTPTPEPTMPPTPTPTEVPIIPTIPPTPTETPPISTEPPEIPTNTPTPDIEEPTPSNPTETPPTETPTPTPSFVGGITFPANPTSTFFNMGVEFAEIDIMLTVKTYNTALSSGPDVPGEWSGYITIETLNKGTIVRCLGIGRNGWTKIEYNGKTGFIHSNNLTY